MKRWLRCVMLKCKFLVCNIKDSRRLSTNTFAHFYSLKNIFSRLLCDFVLPLSLKLGIRVPCKIFNKMPYKLGQCDDRSQFYWFQFNYKKQARKKENKMKSFSMPVMETLVSWARNGEAIGDKRIPINEHEMTMIGNNSRA